jgi:integrase
LDGRDFYLGEYGTPASRAEYDRRIAEWIAAGRSLPVNPQAVTVAEVITAFRRHAKTFYRDADGRLSKAVLNFDEALRPVTKLYAHTPAVEFGPLKLKAVREALIGAGRVRSNINRHITRIRGVFKWAAENELIPPSVYHGLMAVAGLRFGRCEAKESQPVKPVPVEHVEATLPHVAGQVSAMIRLQLLTGMRSGEVTIMRGIDIDTTGKLWVYRPPRHKTQSHGHMREVFLGPRAQAVLRPFLKTDLSAYIFSPADAERVRREALHAARKTPMSCGNRPGSNRRRKPARQPGERYSVNAYLIAIRRGCDRAFPPPAELLLSERVNLPKA